MNINGMTLRTAEQLAYNPEGNAMVVLDLALTVLEQTAEKAFNPADREKASIAAELLSDFMEGVEEYNTLPLEATIEFYNIVDYSNFIPFPGMIAIKR